MKVTRVELTNFRCFSALTLDFANQNLIVGPNASGKSTLVDAIAFGLCGRCRGLDAGGKGADRLIQHSQTAGSVALTLEGIGTVMRTQNAKGQTLAIQHGDKRIAGPTAKIQAALYAKLGTSEALILTALEGSRLLDLPHAEAKALLMSALNVRIAVPDSTDPITLDQLDERYSQYFQDRTVAKKRLQGIVVPEAPGQLPPENLDERLDALRAEEQWLVATRAAQVGKREALLEQKKTLESDLAAQRRLAESLVAKRDRLAAIRREMKELPYPSSTASGQLAEAEGTIWRLTEILGSVERHEPTRGCVLDSRVPCLTKPQDFAEVGKVVKRDLVAQQALREAAREAMQAGLEALRRQQTLEQEIRVVEREIAAGEGAEAASQRLQDSITSLDQTLATLGDRSAAAHDLDQQLAQIRQRIAKGEVIVRDARRLRQQAEDHARLSKEKQDAEADVAHLEELCRLYGPNGLRVQALGQALEGFHGQLDRVLEGFGYQVRFQVEPWVILVNGLPADLLSTSERLRVGVAISMGLADLAGLGFLVIDQGDLLDRQNRAILAELLAEYAGQSILLATRDPDFDPVLPATMTGYRLLEGGRVERLATEAAA